jgi:DHA1 family tetracycline resistance protein-like MFS transporter
MAIFGMAETGTRFLFGIPFLAAWGLAPAAAQSIMTRRVSSSEQGQLQGALGSLASIASLLGPELFTLIYAQSFHKGSALNLPCTAWLFAMFLLLAAAALMLRVTNQHTFQHAEIWTD